MIQINFSLKKNRKLKYHKLNNIKYNFNKKYKLRSNCVCVFVCARYTIVKYIFLKLNSLELISSFLFKFNFVYFLNVYFIIFNRINIIIKFYVIFVVFFMFFFIYF